MPRRRKWIGHVIRREQGSINCTALHWTPEDTRKQEALNQSWITILKLTITNRSGTLRLFVATYLIMTLIGLTWHMNINHFKLKKISFWSFTCNIDTEWMLMEWKNSIRLWKLPHIPPTLRNSYHRSNWPVKSPKSTRALSS